MRRIRQLLAGSCRGAARPQGRLVTAFGRSGRPTRPEVLSDQNRALLKVIRESNPDSIAVLAKVTGRQPGNLSRTLKTMSRYGLVDLQREKNHVRPVVKATEFRILAAA